MTMQSWVGWLVLFAVGLVVVLYAAAETKPATLLAATGTVSVVLAAAGVLQRRALVRDGASISKVESVTAQSMGLVWAWGAIALFAVYVFVLQWWEWWHFCLAFALAGLLSFGFSAMLARDVEARRNDEAMLALGRYLAMAQLAGMIATVVGLAVDPDKEFLFIKEGDWAGNCIFLTGALALAVLSAQALLPAGKPESSERDRA